MKACRTVSGARVDRQGLHVSLTIPLDSSGSSVSSRTRTKTATIQPSSAALNQLPQGPTLTPSAARRPSRSPKSKTLLAAADVATQTSQGHDSKPKAPRRGARSPPKDRQSRSPAAPSTSPPVSAAADNKAARLSEAGVARAGTSQEVPRAVKKGGGKSLWLSRTRFSVRARKPRTRSSTPKTRSTSPADSQNPSAPTIPPLSFETHTARHTSQAGLLEPDKAVKNQERKFTGIQAPSSAQNSHARGSNTVASHTHRAGAEESQAGASVTNQPLTHSQDSFEILAAETEGLALQPPHGVDPHQSSMSVRKSPAKFTTLTLTFIALLTFFWGSGVFGSLCLPSALAALRWMVAEAANFLLSDETKEFTRGSFYKLEDPEQPKCDTQMHSCPKGDESLCWLPTEERSKGCVVLGEDVAAREAGGSIDYSLTTGAVPSKALRLSLLLHKVASFAMPRFPLMRPPSPFSSLDTSEGEIATLRHSYFPLYNHDNDPGKLLADSAATYIITHTHGQVVVAFPRQALVAAVAFETPAAVKPHGQCGPLEVRRFSVFVHLDDSLKATCPVALAAERRLEGRPRGGSEPTWCKVSAFEYRCSDSASLQVFCLHALPKSPKAGNATVQNGSAACDFDRGWPTDRVKLLFENNWGAEATRIRRIRILAGSAQPLDRT
ncbi:hypothetical protein Emag_006880 [Eimeria magna]